MSRVAVHVSGEVHEALCAYSKESGLRKGAIADRAVCEFIKRKFFRVSKLADKQDQQPTASGGDK